MIKPFEDNIVDMVNIDIDNGVKILKDIREDQKEGKSIDKVKLENAFVNTGIKYISSIVQHYLIESKIAKNVLVEYSLLSSTLDPKNDDKLQCCSFIICEDETFKEKAEKYYASCIGKTVKQYGISIYQHPQFLFDIETPAPENSDKKNYISTLIDDKYNINVEEAKDSTYFEYEKGRFYISMIPLDRPFDEMIDEAREYYSRSKAANPDKDIINPDKRYDILDVHKYLHQCCHSSITQRDDNNSPSVYVSFPIFGSKASNILPRYKVTDKEKDNGKYNPLQGIGACFMYFEPNEQIYTLKEYDGLVDQIVYKISKVVRFISANYMFNLGLQLQENARKEALKSAKVAIMSRNMSHNLGSHVMSYLKQHLGSVKDMVNDRILANLIVGEKTLAEKFSLTSDKVELPFLVGMGHFVSYLQERQDFIATIATDFVPYYSTVNFKDGIYDTLNPDKKYERHANMETVLQADNILLGNIARSEGLGRATSPTKDNDSDSELHDIVIKFKNFNGNALSGEFLRKADEANLKDMGDSLDEMRKCNVSLPGGIVGRQAIFSIVENVIRNAAKHGNWRKEKSLELTFNIYDSDTINEAPDDDNYVSSDENIQHRTLRNVLETFYKNAKDGDDLYYVTLTDNLSTNIDSLVKLRKAISESYVDEKGGLKNSNKGIKEMRISASWLRSLSDEELQKPMDFDGNESDDSKWSLKTWRIPDKNSVAPSLYVRISAKKDSDPKNNLQYIFCLAKPKKVAIITTNRFLLNLYSRNKTFFNGKSWYFLSPEKYAEIRNKSYEFVLLDFTTKGMYDDIKLISSSRLYKLSDVFKCKSEDDDQTFFSNLVSGKEIELNKAEVKLYQYLCHYNRDNDKIIIYDGTAYEKAIKDSGSEEGASVVVGATTVMQTGVLLYPYMYRTHYEAEKYFVDFNRAIKNDADIVRKIKFVEGITGNNSTDRLIRNEVISEIWGYKHLHAMKEKIAIFDERLFSKIYGIEESAFDLSDSELIKLNINEIKDRCKRVLELSFNDASLSEYWKNKVDEASSLENLEILVNFANKMLTKKGKKAIEKSDRDAIFQIERRGGLTKEIRAKTYTGTADAQKGIYIYTIIKDRTGESCFYICGLKWLDDDATSTLKEKGGKFFSICDKLAIIKWKDDNLIIEPYNGNSDNSYVGFDKISIHQGLLDKMYEEFGIKDSAKEKEVLTRRFYEYIHKNSMNPIEIKNKEDDELKNEKSKKYTSWFLPGMSIHSGRSKPSETDMPQKLPFIQYASIENAVLDCKYSLVELLDYARYEE